MRRLRWVGIGLFIMLAVISSPAGAESRRTLHGLDDLMLTIDPLHPDAELGGLSRTALREDLVVKLQQIGIRIIPDEGEQSTLDHSKLNLAVHITPLESFPVYSVFISLHLRQKACLTRNLIVCEPVITWEGMSDIRTISVSQLSEVRQDVSSLIARFIGDYQAENSKR